MATSIPGFKAGLLTRLTAALAPVHVSWGNPYPDLASEELVIIGDATPDPGQEPATLPLAAGQRDEDYTLELMVSVVGPAQESRQTLETRAYAIVALIEASLLSWAADSYGGLATWALIASCADTEALLKDGSIREASVTVTLSVSARI